MNLPETVDLEAFVACIEQGSFSAAARKMNVPRQTVTRRVDRLESVLNIQLLKRSAQEFQITESGLVIYDKAKTALAGLHAFVDSAYENSSKLKGRLRITSMPLDWGPLQDMIHEFRRAHQSVTLEVLSSTRYVDLVHEDFDIAIRGGTNIPPYSVARPLGVVRHMVMGSPDYLKANGIPHAIDDLRDHQFISSLNDDGSVERSWPTKTGGEFSFISSFCTNDIVMRRDAVIAGHGLAILPDLAVQNAIKAGQLEPVMTDLIGTTATFALVYLPSRLMRPVVRTFIEFALQWVAIQTDWLNQPITQIVPANPASHPHRG